MLQGCRSGLIKFAANLSVIAMFFAGGGPVIAQNAVPSGQALVLWEILWEPVEGADKPQAVLRFIAPQISRDLGEIDAEQAQEDMRWLCRTHGLPLTALAYAPTGTVVISLMDRPVPRGQTDPDATQYFGLYQIGEDGCVEEAF